MKIQEVVSALERFAPLPLQEDYDNAGLQLGLTDVQEVSGALLCLDVTEDVVDEAVALGCNLIVSHHPLIFRPLRHITGENQVQRTVRKAIINNVALISMHTNLDNAVGGVNWKMAEKMGVAPLNDDSRAGEKCGLFIGQLAEPMAAADFIQMLKRKFGVECVMLGHLIGVSPMVLWHGLCAAPTAVTVLSTEERRAGIASFRINAFGDTGHLYAAGKEPSFSARFCETFENAAERHD